MIGVLTRLASLLPPRLRVHATAARVQTLARFGMFGLVGFIGMSIDTATVYALWGVAGLYVAGIVAYFTAVSGTWFLNRAWTFRDVAASDPWPVQWVRFVAANLPGFVVNRGLYAILVTFVPLAAHHPEIAVFAGAVAGITLNFNLSRKVVFR